MQTTYSCVRWLIVLLVLLGLAPNALAQDEGEAVLFDRFILVNGEVHDGVFVGIREGVYRLESSGFETIGVKPEQVRAIHLAEPRSLYAKEGPRTRRHRITLRSENGQLMLARRNDDDTPVAQPFDPDRYQLIQPDPIPFARWNLTVQGTVTITRGNTETIGAGVAAVLTRTSDFDELLLSYEFGYQETEVEADDTVVSERFHRGEAGYRYYPEPWWGVFAHNEIRNNLLSGIQLWNTLQGGVTFTPGWAGEPLTATLDLGIMWTYRDLTDLPGEHYGGASAALLAQWNVEDRLGFRFRASFDVSFEDSDNWNGLLRLTSHKRLSYIVSAGLIAELTYVNQPAPGFNATDFRMVATLGIIL